MIETMCVPMFFGISGVLFAKHNLHFLEEDNFECLAKTIKRLLILWIPWSLFTELFILSLRFFSNNKPVSFKEEINDYVFKLVFWDSQYWYIQKVILTLLIIYIFCLFNKYVFRFSLRSIAVILVFATTLITLIDRFAFSFGVTGLQYCVYYMEGFVIETCIREQKKMILFWKIASILILGVSIVGSFFENVLLNSSFATVSSIIIIPTILTICHIWEGSIQPNTVLRKLSTWIYMSHLIMGSVVRVLFKHFLKVNGEGYIFFWNYLMVVVISIFSGLLVLYLQKKQYMKWTKYIM